MAVPDRSQACNKYTSEYKEKKENSLYMCTKAFESHPKWCGELSCLGHLTDKRSSTIELIFSNRVSIPTHKETKKTEP
jgi:hypothetical protein